MITPEETKELRKSLITLGFSDKEADDLIIKSKGEDIEENGKESPETVKEMASKEGVTDEKEYTDEDYENMQEEYNKISDRQKEIEKCMRDRLKKSVTEDIGVQGADLYKSLNERIEDLDELFEDKLNEFKKSIDSKIDSINQDEIGKLEKGISELKKTVDAIANAPIPMKSVLHKANFFEKSIGGVDDELHGEKELSISKDRDELIKGLQDEFDKEKDSEIKNMLGDGISDLTISRTPNSHGQKALAYLSRKRNITLVP